MLIKTLVIKTPRRGVNIYFKKPDSHTLFDLGNTYRVTQLGVIVEFKSECIVTTLGPGYTILTAPTSTELDVIPECFFHFPGHREEPSLETEHSYARN